MDVPSVLPICVMPDRYSGAYCGGLFWATARADLLVSGRTRLAGLLQDETGPSGSDISALRFWAAAPEWIAVGNSPDEAVFALLGCDRRPAPRHSHWLDVDLMRPKPLAIGGIVRHREDIYFANELCEAGDWMAVAREGDVLTILDEPWQAYDTSKLAVTFCAPGRTPNDAAVALLRRLSMGNLW
jgi:hypothetical protein